MTNPQIERATYSPEDNKLRLYPAERLDSELYARVKDAGFGWAPKQQLFYAHWSPKREDLCIELASTIEPEDTTMVERAEAKAERLRALAEKRSEQARGFAAAAQSFDYGDQPILAGHHSQRKMEKAKDAAERNEQKANDAANAVRYWNWKLMGTIAHANHKNRPDVVYRRIKTLLTDLRKQQRFLDAAGDCLDLWEQCKGLSTPEKQRAFALQIANYRWDICVSDTYGNLRDGKITLEEAIEQNIELGRKRKESVGRKRMIQHILNRLAYERAQLGPVQRFDGKLTAAIIQTFLRTHGADKPKASKSDYGWEVECLNDLPMHIGEGRCLDLSEDEWRDLMVEVGYEVPAPAAKKAPILNLDHTVVSNVVVKAWSNTQTLPVVPMTKAEYSAIYKDYRGVKDSVCGTFRVKMCKDPSQSGWNADWVIACLTDSKQHEIPDSTAIQEHGCEPEVVNG